MPKRVGKDAARQALEEQKTELLAQETPTPMGEPHKVMEYTPNEERVLRTLRLQGHMRANTTAANLMALHSLRDKGAVEWIEAERKWKLVPKKDSPVVAVLEAMQLLTDEQLDLLFGAFDGGMHDEWDCTLVTGLDQFGPAEWRLALKAAASAVRWTEEHPES